MTVTIQSYKTAQWYAMVEPERRGTKALKDLDSAFAWNLVNEAMEASTMNVLLARNGRVLRDYRFQACRWWLGMPIFLQGEYNKQHNLFGGGKESFSTNLSHFLAQRCSQLESLNLRYPSIRSFCCGKTAHPSQMLELGLSDDMSYYMRWFRNAPWRFDWNLDKLDSGCLTTLLFLNMANNQHEAICPA